MTRCAFVLVLFSGCVAREANVRRSITVDDVLRMAKAGVGAKTLVATIETSDVRARLTLEDILSLKQQGLDDEVLAALIKATEPRRRAAHEPWPAYYYYRGPVYAPYWW